MSKPLFNCSQNAFVSTATKGANLCIEHSAELMKVKPLLTVPYFEQMKVDLKAADLMPDAQTLSALTNLAYVKAESDRNAFFKQFELLITHIKDGNSAADHKSMLLTAGNDYFKNAKKGSWNDLKGIISSALPFVDAQKDKLIAANIMPVAFPATFETVSKNVVENWEKWDNLKKGVSKASPKIEALNAIYTKLISALNVGRIHFEDINPALSKQFIFTTLLSQTQGTPNAGISGRITGTNKKSISKVLIFIDGVEKIAETDEDGKFELGPLSKDKYNVTVQCEGYVTQIFKDFAVKTGVMSRLNVVLELIESTENPSQA
jgi:Carboxypeptidase regulatory-like domain